MKLAKFKSWCTRFKFLILLAITTISFVFLLFLLPLVTEVLFARDHIEFHQPAPTGQIIDRLVITGDAGKMHSSVIEVIKEIIKDQGSKSSILYLGDNVYPSGIPSPEDKEDYEIARARLLLQITPFQDITKRIYFIPGNHDWDDQRKGGWEAVKRQSEIVNQTLGVGHYFPTNGCPGPELFKISEKVQVLSLDTHWWVHEWDKPVRTTDGCETYSWDTVTKKLDDLLSQIPEDVFTIVATHHPLESYGPHARDNDCPGDMGCPEYANMRKLLLDVLYRHRPAICAAGHDHSLQLIKKNHGCKLYVVSGAATNTTSIKHARDAIFARSKLGFFVLDTYPDDHYRLSAYEVEKELHLGKASWRNTYSINLTQN